MSRSSCADSCSICCHVASCASATSDFSPTGNAPSSCRSASNCSTAQRTELLHRHRRPPTSLSRYGTVQSAVEPCTSLNGSPRLNSCFALHLNPTSAQHEPLSASSASTRAPARTEISGLLAPGVLCYLFFQLCRPLLCDAPPLQQDLKAADHTDHSGLLKPLHPLSPHSKYIAFPRGGFLQVAVSEAPGQGSCDCRLFRGGRFRYSTKTYGKCRFRIPSGYNGGVIPPFGGRQKSA